MKFIIFRKADAATEQGAMPSEQLLNDMGAYNEQLVAAGVMRAGEGLKPSDQGVRVVLSDGKASVVDGPFTETKELIAGVSVFEAASRDEVVEWIKRWPASDAGPDGKVSIEIREAGCPGGCAEVHPDPAAVVDGMRFTILLRSSPELEAELPCPQEMLDRLDAHNAAEAKKGVLLAADGLRSSALGTRVNFSAGKASVVDGPFTEIKELVAGYWMIKAASMADAVAWAAAVPYPCGAQVEVEIRPMYELDDLDIEFTPQLREAEQRMRSQQLEAGMLAQLASAAPAW
ncbi:MAG: YciI family protein [Pseudomonadota bacterium]